MQYSIHFHNDFFGVLFPYPTEVEAIYNAYICWDCAPPWAA